MGSYCFVLCVVWVVVCCYFVVVGFDVGVGMVDVFDSLGDSVSGELDVLGDLLDDVFLLVGFMFDGGVFCGWIGLGIGGMVGR